MRKEGPTSGPGRFGSLSHLALRFAGSLSPAAPSIAGEAWARRWLSREEQDLWGRQSNQDRRHAIEVAHTAAGMLGDRDGAGVPTEVIVAALLHDVGKVEADLGTFGRVAATVAALLLGRDAVGAWAGDKPGAEAEAAAGVGVVGGGFRRRAGRYVRHDERGARLLVAVGSAPSVVTWTREHHLPPTMWTLDPGVTSVLKAADGD